MPKNEYRIEEIRYRDGGGFYRVQIKRWWFPIWQTLELPGWFYMFCDAPKGATTIDNRFYSMITAMGFAHNHAENGLDAFFETDETYTYTNMGKLPE